MRAPFGVALQPNPGISASQSTVSRSEGSIASTVRLVILLRMASSIPAAVSLAAGRLVLGQPSSKVSARRRRKVRGYRSAETAKPECARVGPKRLIFWWFIVGFRGEGMVPRGGIEPPTP